MKKSILLLLIFVYACGPGEPKTVIAPWVPYDQADIIAANAEHRSSRMRYKRVQSTFKDRNDMWAAAADQIAYFSEEEYQELKPLILERDIPSLQASVKNGELTYEKIAQWYLFRIVHFENDKEKSLNNMISINPNLVKEARLKDKNRSANDHPIYGIPVILKDNIGTDELPTTAGSYALKDNNAPDAFITAKIKSSGGLILGKANLSEWANFYCSGCPNGFSTAGGQTLNPYGPMEFDTGGSSSGSGSTIAANYAPVAVGTETSGSILSPSSSNSLVGLKPTVGLLSRGGIVPLSSTLDTPGPMTKNVIDNAILLSAMTGEDPRDAATKDNPKDKRYWEDLTEGSLEGIRFGVVKNYLQDSVYKYNTEKIAELGGVLVEFEFERTRLNGFINLLNGDMKEDMVHYFADYASDNIPFESMDDLVAFNKMDSAIAMPYGQGLFEGVVNETTAGDDLVALRKNLKETGIKYFEGPMQEHQLDVILSINNFGAGFAAAAHYPCLTVPMGYLATGQPRGLTFIGRSFEEDKLLKLAYAFEKGTKSRIIPSDYN
ncbi:amidase family protein [Roseivirga misakiensis]|uniref:Amidase n=1 Tax=Roseivirga misakiensis TaxID=1563681 RepID=A0A1E5SZ30_9BACT|nr:amidase family protein [Roseivirga misakiensis]OEK04370.1 amidase [Roseivirga misakiensis]